MDDRPQPGRGARAMTGPVTIRQRPVAGDLDAVGDQLTEAFLAVRDAVGDGRDVVVIVSDADLLGQGEPADAAVATALLGLVRAYATEGVKPGWRVNALARRDEPDADVEAAATGLAAIPGISGQLLRLGAGHLGKVLP